MASGTSEKLFVPSRTPRKAGGRNEEKGNQFLGDNFAFGDEAIYPHSGIYTSVFQRSGCTIRRVESYDSSGRKQPSIVDGLVETHSISGLPHSWYYTFYCQWAIQCFCFHRHTSQTKKLLLACNGTGRNPCRMDPHTNGPYPNDRFSSRPVRVYRNSAFHCRVDTSSTRSTICQTQYLVSNYCLKKL